MRVTPLVAALALAVGGGLAAESASVLAAPLSTTAVGQQDRYAFRLQSRRLRALQPPAMRMQPPIARAPSATTLPVTSCLDDADPGTLRNVLASASEGDTVDLSALTCSTITLTQGAIDTSALGAHQLYDVTLQGPGRDALTIDAAGQSQVLVVGGFSSAKGTFTANDLTIANGTYGGSLAACILGFGGAVALNRVDVKNCHASGTQKLLFGGGVDAYTLQMTDSTITNSSITGTGAHSNAAGGGAYAGGTATLTRSTITGNAATAPYAQYQGYASVGGGLYSRGDLVLTDSTVSGNSIEATNVDQDARGGGIFVHGFATITGSTIDGNQADGDGGGLFKAVFSNYGEPPPPGDTKLYVTNSTISGNAAARGGAIATSRPLYLANSTLAANSGVDGAGGVMFVLAGIYDSGGLLDAQSSIIASNTAGAGATYAVDLDADDVLDVTGTSANNLIRSAGPAITLPADTIDADPLLLALADNGGPTRTQALDAGSPAIDAGNNAAALDFDQRGDGYVRVAGTAADIGAFEVQAASDTIFADGFEGPPARSIER